MHTHLGLSADESLRKQSITRVATYMVKNALRYVPRPLQRRIDAHRVPLRPAVTPTTAMPSGLGLALQSVLRWRVHPRSGRRRCRCYAQPAILGLFAGRVLAGDGASVAVRPPLSDRPVSQRSWTAGMRELLSRGRGALPPAPSPGLRAPASQRKEVSAHEDWDSRSETVLELPHARP